MELLNLMGRKGSGKSTESHKLSVKKYNQANARAFSLTLFTHSEADCIAKLDSVYSKRAYLIDLIRADIAREKEMQNANR